MKSWLQAAEKAERQKKNMRPLTAADDAQRSGSLLNKEVSDSILAATNGLRRFMETYGRIAQRLLAATECRLRLGGYHNGTTGTYICLEGEGLRLYADETASRETSIEEAARFFVAFGPRYKDGIEAWLAYQLELIARDVLQPH